MIQYNRSEMKQTINSILLMSLTNSSSRRLNKIRKLYTVQYNDKQYFLYRFSDHYHYIFHVV